MESKNFMGYRYLYLSVKLYYVLFLSVKTKVHVSKSVSLTVKNGVPFNIIVLIKDVTDIRFRIWLWIF